jgi:hypothetical protein
MKRALPFLIAILSLMLAGCASTLRNDVYPFHQWPTELSDKSYVFEAPAAQEDTIEYASYQKLVGAELQRLGFTDAAPGAAAKLKVSMHYGTFPYELRSLYPADPFWRGPGWRRYGYFHGYYDPFWYGPANYIEDTEQRYRRQLYISIAQAADGKKLYEVTVSNTSERAALNDVMPRMIQSAFTSFPGKSGVLYHVDFKLPE